jgi:hypothetical protein
MPLPPTIPQELLHAFFLEALSRVDGVVVNDDTDEYKEAREVELQRRRVDLLPQSAAHRRHKHKATRGHRMDVDG